MIKSLIVNSCIKYDKIAEWKPIIYVILEVETRWGFMDKMCMYPDVGQRLTSAKKKKGWFSLIEIHDPWLG